MMITAGIFGSGFAAMNTFFPLYAKNLGLRAGVFFVCYGARSSSGADHIGQSCRPY